MEIGQFAQAFRNVSQVGQMTQSLADLAVDNDFVASIPTELARATRTLVQRSRIGNGGLINVPSARWC